MRKILFVDFGGALVTEPSPSQRSLSATGVRLIPEVIPALLKIQAAGYEIAIVSNQGGLRASYYDIVEPFVDALFSSQGVRFTAKFVCDHPVAARCACRKPAIGLVRDFVNSAPFDRQRSAMVGDRDADLEFASNLGITGYKLGATGAESWNAIAHALVERPRVATVKRKTRETNVRVSVDLDSHDEPRARTGLGFFDHMLEQLGKHGGFTLEVECTGDLHIDEHHTVEDVALTLGQALKEALGDKRGIQRYGFLLPMDEADAEVSIDLGGRPYIVFDGTFPRDQVGGLPTELVPHFCRSLAETLGAAIHVRVRGENTHHMIEVTFKALARALRQALKREGDVLPSTKGQL